MPIQHSSVWQPFFMWLLLVTEETVKCAAVVLTFPFLPNLIMFLHLFTWVITWPSPSCICICLPWVITWPSPCGLLRHTWNKSSTAHITISIIMINWQRHGKRNWSRSPAVNADHAQSWQHQVQLQCLPWIDSTTLNYLQDRLYS